MPLSWLIGATPNNLAISARFSSPNSGKHNANIVAVALPTPLNDWRNFIFSTSFSFWITFSCIFVLIKSISRSICLINRLIESLTDLLKSCANRTFSTVRESVSWCLRLINSWFSCSDILFTVLGRTWSSSPNKANVLASILSVFANNLCDLAKW